MIVWFIKFSVQTFQTLIVIYMKGNFRDVHQFITHCPIPLDPWYFLLTIRKIENHRSKISCRVNNYGSFHLNRDLYPIKSQLYGKFLDKKTAKSSHEIETINWIGQKLLQITWKVICILWISYVSLFDEI